LLQPRRAAEKRDELAPLHSTPLLKQIFSALPRKPPSTPTFPLRSVGADFVAKVVDGFREQ
jgi:hypothetical protein